MFINRHFACLWANKFGLDWIGGAANTLDIPCPQTPVYFVWCRFCRKMANIKQQLASLANSSGPSQKDRIEKYGILVADRVISFTWMRIFMVTGQLADKPTRRQSKLPTTNSPTDQLADKPTRRKWNCHRRNLYRLFGHTDVSPVNLRKKSGALHDRLNNYLKYLSYFYTLCIIASVIKRSSLSILCRLVHCLIFF